MQNTKHSTRKNLKLMKITLVEQLEALSPSSTLSTENFQLLNEYARLSKGSSPEAIGTDFINAYAPTTEVARSLSRRFLLNAFEQDEFSTHHDIYNHISENTLDPELRIRLLSVLDNAKTSQIYFLNNHIDFGLNIYISTQNLIRDAIELDRETQSHSWFTSKLRYIAQRYNQVMLHDTDVPSEITLYQDAISTLRNMAYKYKAASSPVDLISAENLLRDSINILLDKLNNKECTFEQDKAIYIVIKQIMDQHPEDEIKPILAESMNIHVLTLEKTKDSSLFHLFRAHASTLLKNIHITDTTPPLPPEERWVDKQFGKFNLWMQAEEAV